MVTHSFITFSVKLSEHLVWNIVKVLIKVRGHIRWISFPPYTIIWNVQVIFHKY